MKVIRSWRLKYLQFPLTLDVFTTTATGAEVNTFFALLILIYRHAVELDAVKNMQLAEMNIPNTAKNKAIFAKDTA
ncbi:MAG TPA: hypothetical protein VL053_18330 [Arachidicoccus sp.]|nr:hypothetical protein [Arachidicoccus sp.]